MVDHHERRRYHPVEENVPLSESVREAVEAHEDATARVDELDLYDHVDPDAIDLLFADVTTVDISLRIDLPDVTVSIWNGDAIDIRVTERVG